MSRETENRGNTRALSEYFSPRSKVKNLTLQGRPLPHFTSFLQETPMKPSQVPNRLPHPPPRRLLPFQSPELFHRDRLGPPQHPPQHLGSSYSSGFVQISPANIGSSADRHYSVPRDRPGPLHHSAQPPGSFFARLAPVSPTSNGTSANKPQPSPPSIFHPPSIQFMRDLSNHSSSSHIRRGQVSKSKAASSYSGSKNVTAQREESNKAQSSDVRSSIHTVKLSRPPVTSSLNTTAAQEGCPLPHSDSLKGHHPSPSTQSSDRGGCSSLSTLNPMAPCQDQQHKRTCSSEKSISAITIHSSQKRRRDCEDCDDSAKKLCLLSPNSGKPNVGNSLSTSLESQPSSGLSSVMELSHKTTDSHLCTEPACGQSNHLELSSTFKPTQSSCTSVSPKPSIKRPPSMGAKQAYISFSQNRTLKLTDLRSSLKLGEGNLTKRCEENYKRHKSSTSLSSHVPQKDTGNSPRSHHSRHTHHSTSVLPSKTVNRENHVEERRKLDSSTTKPASKPNSEQNKTARPRRPVTIPDDIADLFTPDPMTYVVNPAHKTAKPKTNGGIIKSTSETRCSSSSSTTVSGSLCCKTRNSSPRVASERVKLENISSFYPKESELKNKPVTSSGMQVKLESVKCEVKHTSIKSNARPSSSETDTASSEQTSESYYSQSPLLEVSGGGRKQVNEEDLSDVELDLGLSFALDLDLTQSSHSSEEEQLLSLQEMMECVTKPPDTPEKGAFSEPSTPGHSSCQSKTPFPSTTKSCIYKNNLDLMLKEMNNSKKAKAFETQLLTACKEDLLRIAEYEEAEENLGEGISTEHQEFLQRYSLMSSAIREVPPGEVVFNLEKFGQIFNHDTLQLRQCMVNPQGRAQKTLLWSSPAQLRLHVNIGLFQEAYDCCSPCPTQVTRFLFKMMSVHNERLVSEKILQALCDIACTAAYQIVKHGSQQFKVWVPSLADVALVLMNMGAAFVTLFPFENLQPPFTEGDLLEDVYVTSKSPSSNNEQRPFPEHNCNHILKYLSYCMDLCPRAYSDDELLLLLTVVGRVCLDTRLVPLSNVELYLLQYKIVNNIRDWDATASSYLPRICQALTDLTDDHHNMCLLVQLLPDNTRGKQLRRHLSLSMISKLLDGKCTYKPKEKEIQLSELRQYLPRMQPSFLRGMLSCSIRSEKGEDMANLDQQSYYLCYSLLTLAKEASNFQFFPAHQKEQLLFLSSQLETHVKSDIRESEKCLYRSKLKDLVARIYTKWQMLLQKTRPLHGKLYDYWQPVDTSISSKEKQEMDNSDDGEGSVMEDDGEEEETSGTEENEVVMAVEDKEEEEGDDGMDDGKETGDNTKPEEEEGDDGRDDGKETGDNTKPEEVEGDDGMGDAKETAEATELIHEELNQEMPETESQIHVESQVMDEAGHVERAEVETEYVETRETSQHERVAACALVS
ncbi:SMC5-SMC6 complex localization factor protein 2 isoform X2 [Chaetodon auriga]|uniref:SMC5-SMC6 complex localization factor protein 2 isoform X2 n=1 Tax=Chaetodon auriga TaxID=39042 RepID=UPI004032CE5F